MIRVRALAFIAAAFVWFLLAMAIKAEVDFRYRRANEEDNIEVYFRALKGFWKFKAVISGAQLKWEKGPLLEVEQASSSAAGGGRKAKEKAGLRYWRGGFFYRLWPKIPEMLTKLSAVKARFYRGIHCTALEWRMEIGFQDPMSTALASGALWALVGNSVARLHRQVIVEVKRPQLMIVPQFQKAGFACDLHCIFKLRIGHIIFAGLNLWRIFRLGKRG